MYSVVIQKNNSRQSSLEGEAGEGGGGGGGGGPKHEELARCLQRELIRARLHAAEREAAERELTARISELENENKSLRRQRVDNNVAHLQVNKNYKYGKGSLGDKVKLWVIYCQVLM